MSTRHATAREGRGHRCSCGLRNIQPYLPSYPSQFSFKQIQNRYADEQACIHRVTRTPSLPSVVSSITQIGIVYPLVKSSLHAYDLCTPQRPRKLESHTDEIRAEALTVPIDRKAQTPKRVLHMRNNKKRARKHNVSTLFTSPSSP